jgi:multiple sugar transport system ATP-binding protein
MRVEIARLHQTLDATMIYVTHDQIEAMTLADKIIVLNSGRIEQVGGPMELYERPANLFVAQFIGSPRMNLFEARVEAADARGCRVRIEGGATLDLPLGASARLAAGDAVTIGVRPEDLQPSSEGFTLPVEAQVVERLGSQTHVVGTFAGRQVTVVLDGRAPVQPGQAFAVGCRTELLHLFDKNGNALRR